jgi:hypothetical protein
MAMDAPVELLFAEWKRKGMQRQGRSKGGGFSGDESPSGVVALSVQSSADGEDTPGEGVPFAEEILAGSLEGLVGSMSVVNQSNLWMSQAAVRSPKRFGVGEVQSKRWPISVKTLFSSAKETPALTRVQHYNLQ